MLEPNQFMINLMPYENFIECKIVPDVGSYLVMMGEVITFKVPAIPPNYRFHGWKIRDISYYRERERIYNNTTLTPEVKASMIEALDNAINSLSPTLQISVANMVPSDVDLSMYNETYRTWWISPVFVKVS